MRKNGAVGTGTYRTQILFFINRLFPPAEVIERQIARDSHGITYNPEVRYSMWAHTNLKSFTTTSVSFQWHSYGKPNKIVEI